MWDCHITLPFRSLPGSTQLDRFAIARLTHELWNVISLWWLEHVGWRRLWTRQRKRRKWASSYGQRMRQFRRCSERRVRKPTKKKKLKLHRRSIITDIRAQAHCVEFWLTQSRKIFCVSRRVNTPVSPSCIKHSFSGQGVSHERSWLWVISPQSCLQNVAQATTCLADSTIDRRASSAWSFCRPQPFRSQCFFFSAFLSATAEADQWNWDQILELWADSERRTANNMVSKATFHVRQATSMVVGWTAESGCQESTVKSVKAKWTISVERERTLSPTEFSLRWEWFDIDRFPRKMSQRTVVEVIKRQKTQKKADATASTQAPPLRWRDCVWRRVFAIFSASWKFGKTQLRQSKKDVVCPGPKASLPQHMLFHRHVDKVTLKSTHRSLSHERWSTDGNPTKKALRSSGSFMSLNERNPASVNWMATTRLKVV